MRRRMDGELLTMTRRTRIIALIELVLLAVGFILTFTLPGGAGAYFMIAAWLLIIVTAAVMFVGYALRRRGVRRRRRPA